MKRHRGFALYVALVLVGILGIVISLTVQRVRTDALRTRQEMGQAQMRQLLLSGQAIIAEQLAARGSIGSSPLPLPPELSDAALTATSDAVTPGTIRVRIEAAQGTLHAAQNLVYRQTDGHWKLTESTME